MAVVVQPKFQEEIAHNLTGESLKPRNFWILIELGETLVEYRITVDKTGNYAGEDVQFQTVAKNLYRLVVNSSSASYNLRGPSIHLTPATTSYLNISAVALHSNLVALGDSNGGIHIVNRITDQVALTIPQGHFSDITVLKFFPSGKVLISGSLDMQLKVWSVSDGSNPRTLIGHKGAITDVSLLGETGRNLLTSSEDGTVKLWETGSASTLYTFRRVTNVIDPATCMYSYRVEHSDEVVDVEEEHDSLHFETTGYLVYVGYESGTIQQFDVQQNSLTSVKYGSIGESVAVTGLSLVPGENLVVAGYSNGIVKIWGKTKEIEYSCPQPVRNLRRQHDKFIVNSGGNIMKLSYNRETEELELDQCLVGIELVNDIACEGNFIVAGGKEGVVGF